MSCIENKVIKTKDDYLELFGGKKREKALKYALDIRKFEIGLYWTRAKYFWTLITVTFAGFLTAFSTNNNSSAFNNSTTLVILSSVGLVLSLAWHKANKGSKSWQENWENHVDLLEDDVIGPLYKISVLRSLSEEAKKHDSWIDRLTRPERNSVSKVNQFVSMYVCWMWIIFLVYSLGSLVTADTIFRALCTTQLQIDAELKIWDNLNFYVLPILCALLGVTFCCFIWNAKTFADRASPNTYMTSTARRRFHKIEEHPKEGSKKPSSLPKNNP